MTYTAPTGDIAFALNQIAGLDELLGKGLLGDLDADTVAAILEEAGKFASEQIAPLNRQGDEEGALLKDGSVAMPKGWREVYQQWVEAGWGSLPCPESHGGQGLPVMVSMAVCEIWQSANMAFALNPMLTQGAADALALHGSEALKETYLAKLVSGEWSGTMVLTEPHAGSDLRFIKTRAEPQGDGSYKLSGTKIFITYGDHDLVDNIIHMVLARTPDAPEGTKGISLFLVPKFLVSEDGSIGESNDIHAASVEHKLGIHASPTCVMQMGDSGGAVGWLVGEENRGLAAMFTMMNRARLAVGIQGVGIAERALQQAIGYARERVQGTPVNGSGDDAMVPIIEHPDVKRMLLTMRARTAAARAVCFMTARELDLAERAESADERKAALAQANLLTPVAKAYATDLGVEVASDGIQVHGGMGYVEETGAAQHFRDSRIAPIYEGTNGIQAIDLVTRKLPMADGAVVRGHIANLKDIVADIRGSNEPEFGQMGERLEEAVSALKEATTWMLQALGENPQGALAGATPYLRLFGIASGGAWLAKGALVQSRAQTNAGDANIRTARVFAETQAVEAPALAKAIADGADAITGAGAEALAS
ncbi:MAG: acyl-CoA dehydrogenase [Hyphomicrobiales bacterium]|nr:acyl-CoA dehydrogenase [Hyphomicrobiales bacterium]